MSDTSETNEPDRGTTVVYRGWLRHTHNGEADDLLAVPSDRLPGDTSRGDGSEEDRYLAAAVAYDMDQHGTFLSVRFWTAAAELAGDDMKEQYLRHLFGAGDAEYRVAYSEDTGYLWTDESLAVGGHDLLAELESHLGRFVHLEITYHHRPPTEPTL